MANRIIQAVAYPDDADAQLILIDNGDGTYTQTVAFDRDTYPSRAADIAAGNPVLAAGAGFGLIPGVNLFNVLVPLAQQGNLPSGTTDLYTVPTGKQALFGAMRMFNPTIGGITAQVQVKIGGLYFRIASATITVNASQDNGFGSTSGYLLNAGESLAVVTGALGLNAFPRIWEFDATANLKCPRLNALINGNNTLYTCPVGKTAIVLAVSILQNQLPVQSPIYVNDTGGGPLTVFWHQVPSGGTADTTNRITTSASVANGAVSAGVASVLTAGMSLVINSNSGNAGQSAYALIAEI